jgi:hypothetical protein
LYGRSIRFIDAAIIGGALGACTSLIFESGLCASVLPVFPIGYVFVALLPLLFLRLSIPVFMDVRAPRRGDLAFAAGISRKRRIERGLAELANVNKWLLLFVVAGTGGSIACNGAFNHGTMVAWNLGLAVASAAESCVLSFGSAYFLRRELPRPSRKDSAASNGANLSQKMGSLFIALSWNIAGAAVSPLKKQIKAIARRQFVDIFRGDPMGSIVLPIGAIAVSLLFAIVLKNSPHWVFPIIFALVAYGIVLFNDEALQEASGRIPGLLHYRFSVRDFFIANTYVILFLTVPIIIAFLIFAVAVKPGVFTVAGTAQLVATYAYLVIAAGCRHSLSPIPNRDVVSGYFTYGFPIVALPSLGIPVFGALFPVILIALLLSMERDVVKRKAFQRVCLAGGEE